MVTLLLDIRDIPSTTYATLLENIIFSKGLGISAVTLLDRLLWKVLLTLVFAENLSRFGRCPKPCLLEI